MRADDEPELLAGVEDQADGKHVDLDVRDLAGALFSEGSMDAIYTHDELPTTTPSQGK